MMKKNIFSVLVGLICGILCSGNVVAQDMSLTSKEFDKTNHIGIRVGRKIPDDFWTREHLFYRNGDTVRKTLEEYKGKYIILSFWATWCGSCLMAERDVQYFQKKYPDDIAFVKVNPLQTKDDFEKISGLLRGSFAHSYGLSINGFSSIILDEYLTQLFPHTSYPQYIWISKSGIVQLITFLNMFDPEYPPFIVNEMVGDQSSYQN